jgi:SAM-dependent methyltransferase
MQESFTELESEDYSSSIPFPGTNRTWGSQELIKSIFWKESLRKPNKENDLPKAGTPEWFMQAEKLRYSHYGKWVPKLLEFNKHAGERILCIGSGLGTDWIQYAKNGAEVWATTTKDAQDELIRQNFQSRNLTFNLRKLSKQGILFANCSFDVVLLNDFCKEEITHEHLSSEIQRVLKPGGKLLSLSQSLFNISYFLKKVFPTIVSQKHQETDFYTATELKNIFAFCQESRVHKRHLQRNDLPPLFRWIPIPLIERLVGKHLIFKGFKPLSQAIPILQAA